MTPYLQKAALFPPQIKDIPSDDLGIIVVIPTYNELNLIESLTSLSRCISPTKVVEVIVVINSSERSTPEVKAQNEVTFQTSLKYAKVHSTDKLKFHILYHPSLPKKHAGVGLARKIGMDEAVYRFAMIGNQKGVILCYDADSNCEVNYLMEVEAFFDAYPKIKACSIHFEHPIEGVDHPQSVYDAIIAYELHLRYYVHAQRYAGFPLAYQTIGSSMAVRCDAYQQQGGMNKRKAGEDFYFLQKFIPLGNFGELKTTKVIPSPRISDRVPFGTGKAVGEIVLGDNRLTTYAPESFEDLKHFFSKVEMIYEADSKEVEKIINVLPLSVQQFLVQLDWKKNLSEIKSNTTNFKTFEQRFFRWFNAFILMKYVHFARDNFYPNRQITDAALWLLEKHDNNPNSEGAKILLERYRKMDLS